MKEILKSLLKEDAIEYLIQQYPTPRALLNATENELMIIPKISKTKARELKAVIDLSRELLKPQEKVTFIKSPQDVFNHLQVMSLYETEVFAVVYLDVKNRVLDTVKVSEGSLSASIVHPREVYNPGVKLRSNGLICVHNHPSGDPEPSTEDIETTTRLRDAGNIIGIKLVDHIIIGCNRFVSIKERGLI